ncbi:MAG TPA: undecaprenyl-diphosphate phosphatase [Gemmatimonadales bacterium]|nr:undecaprenyl-diphosphate phosphatase [Gemmatimonadales bacterium]
MAPWLDAVVLGLVEGITEFLPISSTGHLIVAEHWLGLGGERWTTFEIFIQLGAILAVAWFYRVRLATTARSALVPGEGQRLIVNLAIGFFPAGLAGLLLHHWVKQHLFSPVVVGITLIVGGVIILLIERWRPRSRVYELKEITPGLALGIGCAQALALIPGVSRSGATIMGAYSMGVARFAATEFSFFLALPTMCAATLFDLYKSRGALSMGDIPVFTIGFVVSFLSALVVIKAFLQFVSSHDFRGFAWYRLGFGALVLLIYRQAAG